jgi:broad specificity phosphatase PhoE
MTGRRLLLIRHSQTKQAPEVSSHNWLLTIEGQQRCKALAEKLAPYRLTDIFTSTEGKAAQTGKLAAKYLGIRCQTAPDLHEHKRDNVGYFPTVEAFENAVVDLFRQPDKLVFGQETANQALARFTGGLVRLIERRPAGNLAVVSHGTVISLFVAAHADIDVAEFWMRLGMPALVTFSLPGFSLLEVTDLVR